MPDDYTLAAIAVAVIVGPLLVGILQAGRLAGQAIARWGLRRRGW